MRCTAKAGHPPREPEQADSSCDSFLGQGQRDSREQVKPSASSAPNLLWSLALLPADVPGDPAVHPGAALRGIDICYTDPIRCQKFRCSQALCGEERAPWSCIGTCEKAPIMVATSAGKVEGRRGMASLAQRSILSVASSSSESVGTCSHDRRPSGFLIQQLNSVMK